MDGRCAAAIHRVRHARIADLNQATVVSRGGHGQVLKFDHAMRRTAPGLGALQGYRPRLAVGLAAQGMQLAIEGYQCVADAVVLQHGHHAIHGVALGNAAQVDLQARAFAGTPCGEVQLQAFVRGAVGIVAGGADRLRIGRIAHRTEAPGVDQRSDGGIKGTRAQPADIQRPGQHLQHLFGQFHPRIDGCPVQAHQVAVGLPGGHLRIHLLHRSLQGSVQQFGVSVRRRVAADRPARSHGRAMQVQAGASGVRVCAFRLRGMVRTRLRHSALSP